MSNEFVIDNSDHLVVQGEPTVIVKGAITLVRRGKELCSIDATYDLASIQDDPELTELVLKLIVGGIGSGRVHMAI
jgi:hypothetical protein